MSNELRNDDDVVMTCPDLHICRNGGVCSEDPGQEGSFFCDCSTAPGDAVFAGLSCEHRASVFCNELNEPNLLSFCTNGGKCKQLLTDGDDSVHLGCNCRPKYTGDFCEFIKGQNVPNDFGPTTATVGTSPTSSDPDRGLGVAFIVIGLFIIVAAVAGLVFCRRRRILFFSQHAIGPSKQATDMDFSVDGAANMPDKELNDQPESVPPTDTIDVFQDVDVNEEEDDGDMTDII